MCHYNTLLAQTNLFNYDYSLYPLIIICFPTTASLYYMLSRIHLITNANQIQLLLVIKHANKPIIDNGMLPFLRYNNT